MVFEGLRAILTSPHYAQPTAYPFGTVLQHRGDTEGGLGMNTLKGMVIGRADFQHPQRIKIIRVSGHHTGNTDDVYVDLWEPVDA